MRELEAAQLDTGPLLKAAQRFVEVYLAAENDPPGSLATDEMEDALINLLDTAIAFANGVPDAPRIKPGAA